MDNLSSYTEAVRKERPALSRIIDELGDLDVLNFSHILFQKGESQADIYRSGFRDLLTLSFPQISTDIIGELDKSLRKNPVVSTADHHSIINHPVYLNSNILLSLYAKNFAQNKKHIFAPPILSFSAIPLNNTAYPRGILLSGPDGEKRFSFFGASQRHEMVCLADPLVFSRSKIDFWIDRNKDQFSKKELIFISDGLSDLVSNSDINKARIYSGETQIFNRWLWSKIFPGVELNFFPAEELVKTFFLKILIKDESLPLYNFLFNLPLDEQDRLFDGIYGAWNLSKLRDWLPGGGTCFFWGVSKEKRSLPLKREKGFLTSKLKEFKPIKWDPWELAKVLEERRIIPSMLLIYLSLAHYGLYCSGAFNQIGYLAPILDRYRKGLLLLSENKEAQRVEQISAEGAHAFLYFLFGKSEDKAIPLCSFNLLQLKTRPRLEDILCKVKVREVFEVTAPLIFPYITDPETRDKMGFSFEEVYIQLKDNLPEELVVRRW